MKRIPENFRWLFYWVPSVVICFFYVKTLPPGITFEDGGYFLAAALGGGYAHPPGYPLYTLLLRGWVEGLTLLNWGPNPAWRGALLSVVFTVLALPVLAVTFTAWVKRVGNTVVPNSRDSVPLILGVLGAFLVGVSFEVWEQSIIIEVYSLHLLLLSLLLYCLTCRNYWLVGLVTGLGLSNHGLSIYFPFFAFCWLFLLEQKRGKDLLRTFTKTLALIPLGMVPYLYIPYIAQPFHPFQWGDPTSFSGLQSLLLRESYWIPSTTTLTERFLQQWDALEAFAAQWTVVGLLLWGYLFFKGIQGNKKGRALFLFLLIAWALSLFGTAYLIDFDLFPDSEWRATVFYIPAYVFAAAIMVLGFRCFFDQKKRWQKLVSVSVVGLVVAVSLVRNFSVLDMSDYHLPQIYLNAMQEVIGESPSVFISFSDEAQTPLFYRKYVEKKMPNLEGIAEGFLRKPSTLARLHSKTALNVTHFYKILLSYWHLRNTGRKKEAMELFEGSLVKAVKDWHRSGYRVFVERRYMRGPMAEFEFMAVGPVIELYPSEKEQKNAIPFASYPAAYSTYGANRDVWNQTRRRQYAEMAMVRALMEDDTIDTKDRYREAVIYSKDLPYDSKANLLYEKIVDTIQKISPEMISELTSDVATTD